MHDLATAHGDIRRALGQVRRLAQGAADAFPPARTRIETLLTDRESVTWKDLFEECNTRVELVCCLLAILELCRMRRIRAHQHHGFGDIRIFTRDPGEAPQAYVAVEDHIAAEDHVAVEA